MFSVSLAPLWKRVLQAEYPLCGKIPSFGCLWAWLLLASSDGHSLLFWKGQWTVNPQLPSPGHSWFCRALSSKCPLRLPWITSFQVEDHSIFTFTYVDAVPYLNHFHAILCTFFRSTLPLLNCRNQNCTQHSTCGQTMDSGIVMFSVPFLVISFV